MNLRADKYANTASVANTVAASVRAGRGQPGTGVFTCGPQHDQTSAHTGDGAFLTSRGTLRSCGHGPDVQALKIEQRLPELYRPMHFSKIALSTTRHPPGTSYSSALSVNAGWALSHIQLLKRVCVRAGSHRRDEPAEQAGRGRGQADAPLQGASRRLPDAQGEGRGTGGRRERRGRAG